MRRTNRRLNTWERVIAGSAASIAFFGGLAIQASHSATESVPAQSIEQSIAPAPLSLASRLSSPSASPSENLGVVTSPTISPAPTETTTPTPTVTELTPSQKAQKRLSKLIASALPNKNLSLVKFHSPQLEAAAISQYDPFDLPVQLPRKQCAGVAEIIPAHAGKVTVNYLAYTRPSIIKNPTLYAADMYSGGQIGHDSDAGQAPRLVQDSPNAIIDTLATILKIDCAALPPAPSTPSPSLQP